MTRIPVSEYDFNLFVYIFVAYLFLKTVKNANDLF